MDTTVCTADLWDEHADHLTLLNLPLQTFGKRDSFFGQVVTLKVYEDNSFVKKELQTNGRGKVLLVDGGGSRRCALVGDNIAQLAIDNEWSGVIVYGCIRDSKEINQMDIGIKALGTCPVKTIKRDEGLKGVNLLIEGTEVAHGDYIYADMDGVVVSKSKLL